MTAMSISREEGSSETEGLAKTEEATPASSSSGRLVGLAFTRDEMTPIWQVGLSSKSSTERDLKEPAPLFW